MDINSWIFTKKYFDPETPRKADDDLKIRNYWAGKQIEREDTFDHLVVASEDWKTWPDIAGLNPVKYLIITGIIPPNIEKEQIQLNRTTTKKLQNIMMTIIPDQNCIKKQIVYIYSKPVNYLLLVNYAHDESEMLSMGRNIYSKHSLPIKDRMVNDLDKTYRLAEKIPKQIIDKYLQLSSLQRYLMLNALIIRAPYCQKPLILLRGSKADNYDLDNKNSGYEFVSNSILSCTLNTSTARGFAKKNCCIYVFYLTKNVPRLFINNAEKEFLLPAGLLMNFDSVTTIMKMKIYRIKVLKAVEEANI